MVNESEQTVLRGYLDPDSDLTGPHDVMTLLSHYRPVCACCNTDTATIIAPISENDNPCLH